VDLANRGSIEKSRGLGNFIGGALDAFCGLGNLSTVLVAHNNVSGSIPDCIQSLANATVLDLGNNALQGTTPDSLCYLHHLEELILRGNLLQGTVPGCFGKALKELRVLDYKNSENRNIVGKQVLSGTLPVSLCNLGRLEILNFHHCQLSGTLPDCLGASQPQLHGLALQHNLFQGTVPPSICQSSMLEYLWLSANALTGTIPSCLGALHELSGLGLDFNQLHGPFPEELCQAHKLRFFTMEDNALTGTLPSCLGNLKHLYNFDMSVNRFNGTLPEEICEASWLEGLYLWDNSLSGTIPSCLGSLTQFTTLLLEMNYFTGPIPQELCQGSALNFLILVSNFLTGTIPGCLGNLSQLTELALNDNHLSGSISDKLCQGSALQLIQFNDNALTGSLPSCLATSFPSLASMLLYNNYLTGALPSEWALPSLISIMLSNNPKLSGSLPSGLFLQQPVPNSSTSSWSPNVILHAVVIEGTSIEGTLPAALCSAPQLTTLAVSGNEIGGSLPSCITSLQNLQTLRVSNNHLTGTLPIAIDNMTSLAVLDLSVNRLRGHVPASLGNISPYLYTTRLQLNRLSCDLPASVLDWQVSSVNASFSLLDGNLFGCSARNYFQKFIAISIQDAVGLRNANEEAFDAYSCGNSEYVLPVITILIVALPVAVWLIGVYCRGRLALQWRISLGWLVNPTTLINELDHADRQLRTLGLGVMAAATLAGSVALVLSLNVADSAFECEYMAAPTLANKRAGDMRVLSLGFGAASCLGLVLGLAPWWHRLVAKGSSSVDDYGGIFAEKNFLSVLEGDAEAWDFDAERVAEAAPEKPDASSFEGAKRLLNVVLLLLTLAFLTIGPNVGYVLVVLSNLTQQQKVASEVAVTLAKTAIGTLLVPRVARRAVKLILLHDALTYVRFRIRMATATALSALMTLLIPVAIVFITDKRCLYYTLNPQPAVDTEVPISYCAVFDDFLLSSPCLEYGSALAKSTYTPSFAYDGELCVSAVLSVYGPVFLGVALLAATLPASFEMVVVPWLAPWCYRNSALSALARTGLAFFRMMTWNVWPTLADAGVLPPDFSLGASKLDYLAQRVVERAFVQIMVTLLVALTFGIAVPAVGGACAVAAFVQVLHHRHVLGQIVGLGRLEQPVIVPNLMGCTDVPVGCAAVITVTVMLVWVCGAISYLEPVVVGAMLLFGLIVALLASCIASLCLKSRTKVPRPKVDRAPSIASSDTSQGVLLESLIASDVLAVD
jgi:Leucine-rich repeat (LRR) protein